MRKPHCHFGWDWGPHLPLTGITDDIWVECFDNRITDVEIKQIHENGKVTVKINPVVDGVGDRSEAYTYAEERVREVIEDNPSIEVVIDLHRDGVNENTRLVTNINGKDTAQLMLLNGLCRTVANGPISYLQNDYLTENLAFSFKIQRKAAEYYPDLMRRIYLRSYQYNLHILPRCLLVECGAQTNTVEEAQNAMPLLADMLYLVLTEKIYDK